MNSNSSYCPGTPDWGQNRLFFVPCDLEIWRMTLKNNIAPLLCYFKLCVSFHSHWWIQTRVIIPKRPNWGKFCFDLCELDLWPLILTVCMDITWVNGNNSWKFHDDTMRGTLRKRRHRRTDGQTDGRTYGRTDWRVLRAAWSQLKTKQRNTQKTSYYRLLVWLSCLVETKHNKGLKWRTVCKWIYKIYT